MEEHVLLLQLQELQWLRPLLNMVLFATIPVINHLGKETVLDSDSESTTEDVGNAITPFNSRSPTPEPIVPLPLVIFNMHVQLHGAFVRGYVQETIDLNISLENVFNTLKKHALKKAKITHVQALDLDITFGTRYITAPKNVSTGARKKNVPPVDVDGFADFETEGNLTTLVNSIRNCRTGNMVLQVLAIVERGQDDVVAVVPIAAGRQVISIMHFLTLDLNNIASHRIAYLV